MHNQELLFQSVFDAFKQLLFLRVGQTSNQVLKKVAGTRQNVRRDELLLLLAIFRALLVFFLANLRLKGEEDRVDHVFDVEGVQVERVTETQMLEGLGDVLHEEDALAVFVHQGGEPGEDFAEVAGRLHDGDVLLFLAWFLLFLVLELFLVLFEAHFDIALPLAFLEAEGQELREQFGEVEPILAQMRPVEVPETHLRQQFEVLGDQDEAERLPHQMSQRLEALLGYRLLLGRDLLGLKDFVNDFRVGFQEVGYHL